MERIKLITDSGSDLPRDLAEQYNITILPMGIVIDGEVFFEGETLDAKEYVASLPNRAEIPTTTMVPLERIEREFRNNLDTCDHQIFVTISSCSSGTFSAANLVKQQIEESTGKPSNIIVLDSLAFSMIYGKTVLKMAQLAQQGASLPQVLEVFDRSLKSSTAYFMVSNLQHLQKGGRIKPGVAIVGSLLGIKPILTVRDGLVDSDDKVRGTAKALDRIADNMLAQLDDPKNATVWVANCVADEETKQVIAAIKRKGKVKELIPYTMGACVGTHAGPGLVGLIFDKRVSK